MDLTFIKVAIDSRYVLAVAHVSYLKSLRYVGIALRSYAESQVEVESSLSISDKTPSQTSYPFPSSLSHIAEVEVLESLLHHESPLSPLVATTLSYTRSGGRATITVRINAFGNNNYLDDESTVIPMPPPPPESGVSWDFFDPIEDSESFRFAVHCSEFKEFRDEEKDDQWLHVGSDRHCMMQPLLDEKFSGNFSSAIMGNECGNSYAHCLVNSTISRGVEGGKGMVVGEARELELSSLASDVSRAVADRGTGGRSSSNFKEGYRVANSLIDMYAKCKCIDKALEVFHSTLDKNIVSQTSIILGLGINIGRPNPNSVTLVYVLSACGRIGSFDTGKKDPSPCIENWRYAEPGKGAHATKLFQRMIQIVPVKRLCRTQNILTVNRQFPGPTMEARNGDSLAIKEVNDGPYNISIHWHGLRMLRNPWADGPSYVTQCPIQPGGSYTYHFTIQNQELFVAIANHRMTVVATNVAHTNPFTTNVTADQTPGRY
ncbi:hypothetical protein JHK86_001225 [Glycine max]|nr:hypothetical protein JHK86_001225 [Glycine max]